MQLSTMKTQCFMESLAFIKISPVVYLPKCINYIKCGIKDQVRMKLIKNKFVYFNNFFLALSCPTNMHRNITKAIGFRKRKTFSSRFGTRIN